MKKERNKKKGKKERKKERKKEGKKEKKNFKVKSHICSCKQQMTCVYGNQGVGLSVLNSVSP